MSNQRRIHIDWQPAAYVRDRDGAARCMFTGRRLGVVPRWYVKRLRRKADRG